MTKAGCLAASIAASLVAASSAAFAAVSLDRYAANSSSYCGDGSGSSKKKKQADGSTARANAEDKFAPRFDGLRFIGTLVTAHR